VGSWLTLVFTGASLLVSSANTAYAVRTSAKSPKYSREVDKVPRNELRKVPV
jgi:hypothetical protein